MRRNLRSSRIVAGVVLPLAMWLAGGGNAFSVSAPAVRSGRGISFVDLHGNHYNAASLSLNRATIFMFLSAQCPVSNLYGPRIAQIATAFRNKGVQTFSVYSDRQETLREVEKNAQAHGYTFPVVKDTNNVLADRLGATTTPEAIVLDSSGTIRYAGRIDDNPVSTRVSVHDLEDAVTEILAGGKVLHASCPAFGCVIRRVGAAVRPAAGAPTYAHDVAAILRAKCESCHRPGEVAPFSLQTYTQASAWAADIKKYTQNGTMPPWKPAPGFGDFRDEQKRVLSGKEMATLAKWADCGAPQGDPKQTPPPRHFVDGWQLGEPDVVITPSAPY
ncbi:MAG TPA: redoxin domain-containing protein, partial [Chthonomonadales bacterium]|nr:redoxin domain-containing protein [Chthonomonadales bacterium]